MCGRAPYGTTSAPSTANWMSVRKRNCWNVCARVDGNDERPTRIKTPRRTIGPRKLNGRQVHYDGNSVTTVTCPTKYLALRDEVSNVQSARHTETRVSGRGGASPDTAPAARALRPRTAHRPRQPMPPRHHLRRQIPELGSAFHVAP